MFTKVLVGAMALLAGLTPAAVSRGAEGAGDPLKLVVWITVDQLRGDMPWRYVPRDQDRGFRFLSSRGVSYLDARYAQAVTFTAVGHATLFTGGYVPDHGIAGNEWYERAESASVEAVEDAGHPLLDGPAGKAAGLSPRRLTSTTIGDELIMATRGRSRVFSVSTKDRGAILPGGLLGKAFWYSTQSGQYVTSTYYYKEYPAWVREWNRSRPSDRYREEAWELKSDRAGYVHGGADDRPCEHGYKHLKSTFPHRPAAEKASDYYSALTFTPFSDELTLSFAEELIRQERLGRRDATDLIAISFSATDQIGHAWGPESLEAEDNVRRLDDLLAGFFTRLSETVGLDKTLIILAADHGADDIPECAETLGLPAGRHEPGRIIRRINDSLRKRFQVDRDLLKQFWNPSLYFDHEAIRALGLDPRAVETAAAEEARAIAGIACAATRSDLLAGRVPADSLGRAVQLSFHPTRSGDVLIFPAPFWYLYHDPKKYAAMHGSPHSYDTLVPILVAGPGIAPRAVHRRVSPADLAPTVAALLGIKPPSGSVGRILPEIASSSR